MKEIYTITNAALAAPPADGKPPRPVLRTRPSLAVLTLTLLLLGSASLAGCSSTSNGTQSARSDDAHLSVADIGALPGGVYHGTYRVRPPFGTVAVYRRAEVAVTVNEGRVQEIEILRPRRLHDKLHAVTSEILEQQSTNVDVTSGATWSKTAVLGAVDDALAAAWTTPNKEGLR